MNAPRIFDEFGYIPTEDCRCTRCQQARKRRRVAAVADAANGAYPRDLVELPKCDNCREEQFFSNGESPPLYQKGERLLCHQCALNSIPAHQGWAHVSAKLPADGSSVRLVCPQCGEKYDSDEWVGGDMCCESCAHNACYAYADIGYYREGGEPFGRWA